MKAGLEVIWSNDLDKHATNTYRRNLGDHVVTGSIYEHYEDVRKLKDVDCVIGGPPCQGFSVAGKMSPSDDRSKLVFAFMDIVEVCKPKMFVMENVRGLGELAKFELVRNELQRRAYELGFDSKILVFNAKDFGCPTSRQRMFFIGIKDAVAESIEEILLSRKTPEIASRTVFEQLGPQGTDINPKTCNAEVTLASNPILRKSPYAGMLFNGLGRPVNPALPCATLPASMGGNKTPIVDENQIWGTGQSWVETYHAHLMDDGEPYDWKSAPEYLRRLTINEAKFLQTFPDDFIFEGPNTSIYSQIGNCVPCNLGKSVISAAIDLAAAPEILSKGQKIFSFSNSSIA